MEMKYVQSRHFTSTNGRRVRLHVVHDMEAPEKSTTAEAVANYFARGVVKASAHYCYDDDSAVQCVKEKDVAYAAPGANHDGIQHELAGYASQSPQQWRDDFSLSTLSRCALVVADGCDRLDIPKVWLSDRELAAGKAGIIDHAQASRVYKRSSHTDCGPNFPKDLFVDMVRSATLLPQPDPNKVAVMIDCVDFLVCPLDGGFQKLQSDGGVFNSDGCTHFHGSYLSLPPADRRLAPGQVRRFVGMARLGETGYTLMTQAGEPYRFLPKG